MMVLLLVSMLTIGCPGRPELPEFELKVLGNSNFLAGSYGSFRIIAYNPENSDPVSDIPIKIYLPVTDKKNEKPMGEEEEYGKLLFTGNTNKTGTLSAFFKIPDNLTGSHKLTIVAGYGKKINKVETVINIARKFKIYVTTDKPLYQPGQVMHIRSLALNVPTLTPLSEKEVIIEVQDGKGNKVFKQKGKTSKFGIASATFQLADEVNMGEYHVRAIIENEQQELNVEVKKYVLPKFKIAFSQDRKFYAPGDILKGDIQVDYFFGKPVAGGNVIVKLYTFDAEFIQTAEVKGRTDKGGHYSFELKLPDYLVGQPIEKGGAVTKLDVEVTDTADHKEKAVRMIPISKEAVKLQLIPESGILKPGIENIIYVLTTYPDGSPVKAGLTLKSEGQTHMMSTDEAGITTFAVTPKNQGSLSFEAEISTAAGDKTTKTVSLPVAGGEENIILRVANATYKVGDTMECEVISTKTTGTVYLDFIRDRQTVLTQSIVLKGSRTSASFEVNPLMTGMLTINAYCLVGKENNFIRDTRNVFISSADDLRITVKPDKSEYKPGEDAKIGFIVTDKKGTPVLSAMSVDIVDEAVFAMGEMLPGLEKIYFLLEKELMEPKYEIHGITIKDVVVPMDNVSSDQQIIKKILFSQIPSDQTFSVNIDTLKDKMNLCYQRMSAIRNALYRYHEKTGKWAGTGDLEILVKDNYLKAEDLTDPWGRKFVVKPPEKEGAVPEIVSPGPDGVLGNGDDVRFSKLQESYWEFEEDELGVRGGEVRMLREEALPKGAMMDKGKVAANEVPMPSKPNTGGDQQKQVRVREYFPETLYTNPEVVTDEKGNASISLAMADSITTWRLSAFASSLTGRMGNTTAGIKVFQDFFIDIDFPVALTQGDEISVPVAVYNYLKEDQTVKLKVDTSEKWFILKDKPEKLITLKPDEVRVVYFRMKVDKIGKHKMTVNANGTKFSDAVRREVEVLPDGIMMTKTKSGKITQRVLTNVEIPTDAVPGASKILVSIYPGVLSQVVDGLEKVFRMPSGCFEQTTSTTYPNVLVLDYMKKQKKVTPELQMKAEGYINTGYQRLVSFEVQGGGFSWFGDAPANRCLTALGLMEFRDMSKVHEVDENLINRTQAWLASQQNKDGSWSPDANYLHAETWKNIQGGNVPVTAYIVWALSESGYRGNDLTRGVNYLKANAGQVDDPYVLALTANAFAQLEPEGRMTKDMLEKLRKKAVITGDSAHWETKVETATYSSGSGADIETTALAAMAFMKVSGYEDIATKAVNYIIKSKDSFGTWYSTQSTVLAMKALILSQEKATQKVNAKVKIKVNDGRTETFDVNSDNFDVFRQADFGDQTVNKLNKVEILIEGEGSCYYQISTRYYMPWGKKAEVKKPLSIDVKYDRTTLRADDMLRSSVTITNNTKASMKMVMIDLGIPPGFTLMTSDLDVLVGKKFKKYSATSRQVIIYIDTLKPGERLQFDYRMKAKYPLRAKSPESRTYQYYNPEVNDVSRPVTIEVK